MNPNEKKRYILEKVSETSFSFVMRTHTYIYSYVICAVRFLYFTNGEKRREFGRIFEFRIFNVFYLSLSVARVDSQADSK